MSPSDDLEARVSALESQVSDLNTRVRRSEHDAAAARVLAGGADRDVTDIRGELRDFRQATTASFNATREDLADLNEKVDRGFAEVNSRFAEVDRGFAEVNRGFAEMRGLLDMTAGGQQRIVDLLDTVIARQGEAEDR